MVITIPLDTLRGGLAAASLDTGTRITAGEARRLACQAGIIPAVLGGRSEVLDLGRAPWSRGGPTDTDTGRLLCHRHHRLIHDDRYQTTRHPNGKVSFHRTRRPTTSVGLHAVPFAWMAP